MRKEKLSFDITHNYGFHGEKKAIAKHRKRSFETDAVAFAY